MKKMILTAAVIAAAAMTVSCNKTDENTGLGVDVEAINYPLSGGTYDISLTSGKPWEALYCAEWLTVTPESGTGDATVTVGTDTWANEDSEEVRLAGVYFTDGTDTVSVLIGQVNDDNYTSVTVPEVDHVTRGYFYLNVSSNNIQSPSQGGTYTITIDTNTNWEIHCDADWLSLSPMSGYSGINSLTVSTQEWINPDNEESRTATFRIHRSRHEFEQITVTQHNDTTITPDPAAI